jgi:uncharacterized protein (TIGR00297 family)
VAAALAVAVALIAWRLRALSAGGGVAATLVGTAVLWGTGWTGAAVLLVFFIASSLVSHVAPVLPASDAKSHRRDQWQVLANGGPAALAALLGFDHPSLALWIVTGSLASAAADTWATSLGTMARTPPRLLVGRRTVPPGTSGGITLLGNLAALTGAVAVSASAAIPGGGPHLLASGTLIGFAGMLVDSVLGATLQGRFYCPRCESPSEWRVHRCGQATVRKGGIAWLNNDGVNLAATSVAALLAAAAWFSWGP